MKPSAIFSPDLDWWFHDGGAAFGETSAIGASLARGALYGKDTWKPDPSPNHADEGDRKLRRVLPGETNVIDPRDFFVDASSTVRSVDSHFTRKGKLKRRRPDPQFTAVPKTLGYTEPVAQQPDPGTVARARRVQRAWQSLSFNDRADIILAYWAQGRRRGVPADALEVLIDRGAKALRAYRLAAAPDAERLIKELAHAA